MGIYCSGDLNKNILGENLYELEDHINEKLQALINWFGFIDGMRIAIDLPNAPQLQKIVYNGHKRRHALKCQAVTLRNGLFLKCFGMIEYRRHGRCK